MAITSSIGHGLEIGRRALDAQQAALNATSHNIANANTPGFSRRQANLHSASSGIRGGIGSGVDLVSVERQRSRFLDAQVRVEQQVLGRWDSLERSMQSIELLFNEPAGAGSSEAGTVFNEPSGTGLSGSLSRFWNAWQDLANVPESGAARAALRQEGVFLSEMLHQYNDQLLDTHQELNNSIVDEVGEINEILDQLATVNREIPRAKFEGGTAADLEDLRDLLLDQLSFKVDISAVEKENGQVSVLLSGHNLVELDRAVHLRVRHLSSQGLPLARLSFADDGTIANVREGRLSGLMQARDEIIPGIISRLDQMAFGMVEELNLLHQKGFGSNGSTGLNFFAEGKVNASNIVLDDAILDDLSNIAASADGGVGDNGAALQISGLRNKRILAGGSATVDQFYHELLGDVGARSKEAKTMATNHRLLDSQLENRRQSVVGVSLNEEAAQLVLFQRAYQAAARTVSIVDDVLEVTINL